MRFSITPRSARTNSRSSCLDVAQRINRAVGMGHGRVLERANHVEQLVGVAQPRELIGRDLGRLATVERERRRGQVDVGHVGRNLALGLEELGQLGQTLVGNLDDADVDGQAAKAARLCRAAGERVENSRLARPGKANDRYLHPRRLVGVSSRRADQPG